MIAQHIVGTEAGDIEAAIGAEGELLWRIEPPASRRHEDIDEGTSDTVETQYVILAKAGHVEMSVGTEG